MNNMKSSTLLKTIIILYLFIIIFPFFWVTVTSFRPESEIWSTNALQLKGATFTDINYVNLFKTTILNSLKNSLIISTITTVYVTMIASLCAYSIARLEFKFKKLLTVMILATSMFPQMIAIGPIYRVFVKLGWTNSYYISLPYSMITLPIAVFILITHFSQIPREMEESAIMDGSSKINTFFKIILPLATPGIFTSAIMTFIGAWNEFLLSLTLNTNESWRTATVSMSFLRGQFEIFWGQVTAATVVVTIPTLIIVILFQRQIVSGITSGALKE
ncbi:carbohydrate ABC transporter permease [Tissierella sp. Yu-01]|uniref:carbohydrate ABC transporter permease n=1 Tax=Tissierella sp. Yu-01 TaxID=3035694 RepID=UPI00240DBD1E|nr:carbohydrate ABC transporter permease [Tissierella sp. Yu-01]WFA07961.1 carbohydrate ABC transporter permease [Tissierella sp. Yu-01]